MEQETPTASAQSARRFIRRPRLLELLDGAQSQRILLVAPAGYGKTTLARQWLSDGKRRGVWYRATAASADVGALASGLAKAAEQVLEGAGGRLQERLRQSHAPNSEADALGAVLAADLADWPPGVWFVVEDYHHLAETAEAEIFMDSFSSRGSLPLLITSRVRPAWASARRFLYGEITELGRNVLAMTHEEAAQAVPSERQPRALAGLVALAEGWPAVIGLASLVQSPPMSVAGDEVPAALHSYFAEELFQELSVELQTCLIQLSLAATIDARLASTLFEDRAATVLQSGYERGFLNRDGDSYDLHPLLRQFLRAKLAATDPELVATTTEVIGKSCLSRRAWDEAFDLTNEFALSGLLRDLFRLAMDELLTEGRLATLEHWIDTSNRLIPGDETVALADVELAFRRGRWREAEQKARELGQRLPTLHPIASRVLFRAAQVAQLDDRPEEALEFLAEAAHRSTSATDRRRVVWSRFLTLTDLEDPGLAADALREFKLLEPESVEDMVRLSQGPVHFAVRWGGVEEELERQRPTLQRLDSTVDPVVRSGFLQSYCTALNLAARYEEAYDLAERQLEAAERFGLAWVRAHALELRALSQMGMRAFRDAETSLRTALELAEDSNDVHAQSNATALLARIPLMQGVPAQALRLLEGTDPRNANPGMEGELRSLRALTLACLARPDEAQEEIHASSVMTNHLEAKGLRAYAAAAVAHAHGDSDLFVRTSTAALEESLRTGNTDAWVLAYRASPAFLHAVADGTMRLDERLTRPLQDYDSKIAERIGLLRKQARPSRGARLTEREQEVLALLRQGLSNQQIAHALWIAESTTKVHVRHIFEKLGVRSRTAAAVYDLED